MGLLSSKYTWEWTAEHRKYFATLHSALCETPVLKLPDFRKPFVMEPNASDLAVGAILLQKYDDGFQPHCIFQQEVLACRKKLCIS